LKHLVQSSLIFFLLFSVGVKVVVFSPPPVAQEFFSLASRAFPFFLEPGLFSSTRPSFSQASSHVSYKTGRAFFLLLFIRFFPLFFRNCKVPLLSAALIVFSQSCGCVRSGFFPFFFFLEIGCINDPCFFFLIRIQLFFSTNKNTRLPLKQHALLPYCSNFPPKDARPLDVCSPVFGAQPFLFSLASFTGPASFGIFPGIFFFFFLLLLSAGRWSFSFF